MAQDVELNIYEKRFTQSEVVRVTGVSPKNLQNWLSREIVRLHGEHEYTPGGGRRLYCPIDIVMIAAIHELTRTVGITPVTAGQAASLVQERLIQLGDQRQRAKHDKDYGPQNPLDLLLFIDDEGESKCMPRLFSQRNSREPKFAHIVIPVDKLLYRVINALFDLLLAELPPAGPSEETFFENRTEGLRDPEVETPPDSPASIEDDPK